MCKAFEVNKGLLNSIVLENNGITDSDFAVLLEGLNRQLHIKCIVTKHNEFGEHSLLQVKKLMIRKKPANLDELRIIHCKISPLVTDELITCLAERQAPLSKLSLVSASFNDESFRSLIEFI